MNKALSIFLVSTLFSGMAAAENYGAAPSGNDNRTGRSDKPIAAKVPTAMAADVRSEHLNPANPAWKFSAIPGASKSDIAQNVAVSVAKGTLHTAGGDPDILVNGKVAASPSDLPHLAFLADTPDGGSFMFDLGKVQPVTAFNSYSWHEWTMDQGARAPQVYTLYGQAAAQPDPSDLSQWTKIAEVDTRPNATGAQWGGQYGVSITVPSGRLGDFRYLLMAVRPTLSPLQGDKNIMTTGQTKFHSGRSRHEAQSRKNPATAAHRGGLPAAGRPG